MKKDIKKIIIMVSICFGFIATSQMIVWLDKAGWVLLSLLGKYTNICKEKNGVFRHLIPPFGENPSIPSVYGVCECPNGYVSIMDDNGGMCQPVQGE